ncbi:MAG: hypothetical protein ACRCYQ_00115 [Nocardioides sp.]
MRKNPALLAVATLTTVLLSGCGSDTEAYCDSLKSATKDFDAFENADMADLDAAIKTFHKLAKAAPDEVADEWKTLDGTLVTVEKTLDEAGLKFSDLEDLQAGKIPEDLDPAKLTDLGEDLQKLDDKKAQKAADAIEKHAKDECDVDLNAN